MKKNLLFTLFLLLVVATAFAQRQFRFKDGKFKVTKVADKIFSKNGTRLAPYSGVPTFLMAPHMPVDANEPDFGNLQVAIVGVPMDLGVTNRPGSRFGPRAMRTIVSRLMP